MLAPNTLYRGGRAPQFDLDAKDPGGREKWIGQLMPLIRALDTEKIVSDAESYLDFFATQDGVAPGPVVMVGYCMGGTNALKVIEAYPDRVKGVAGYHGGRLATDQPDSPHLHVGTITGELYFAHADNDHSMSADQIKALEAALDDAGVTYTSETYEGAPHGFTMSDTSSYHEEGEKRHWTTLFAFLDRVLPGAPS